MILTGRRFYRAGVKLGGVVETPPEDPASFSFTIDEAVKQSIGIYDSNNVLIRTMESGEDYAPDTYQRTWDRRKDPVYAYDEETETWGWTQGPVSDPGTYTIKRQINNLIPIWEGARIGNYSTDISGPGKHRGFQFYTKACIVGDTVYCWRNYEEGWSALCKFNVNTPFARTRIKETFQTNATASAGCSDGVNVYVGGEDSFSSVKPSFIWAFKVSDETEVSFASGTLYERDNSIRDYPSVINKVDGIMVTSTGIAIGVNPTVTVNSTANLTVGDTITFNSVTGGSARTGGTNINRKSFKILSIPNSTSITIEATTTGTTYASASLEVRSEITGMAANDDYIFVARRHRNTITVLDKTGAVVNTITSTEPQRMVCEGNNLWVNSSDSTTTKYSIGGNGALTSLLTLDVDRPTDIDYRAYSSEIVITDGNGGSDALKAFNLSGALQWTHGTGSYNTDPRVYNDKFMFYDRNTNAADNTFSGFVACHADGSMWIGDSGNYRVIKVDASRNYILTTGYLPHSYSMQVCQNDPTRVFSEYMEFKIDYSKELDEPGAWELVRNYRGAIPDVYHLASIRNVFKSACSLPQTGRTYGIMLHTTTFIPIVVELPLDAPIRFTKVTFSTFEQTNIHPSGDLRRYTHSNGASFTLYGRAYSSTDVDGDPVWSSQVVLQTVVTDKLTDPLSFVEQRSGRQTANGYYVVTNPEGEQEGRGAGFHVGLYYNNQWMAKTSKSTGIDYDGPFPANGDFDTGNGTQAAGTGGDMTVCENIIIQQYRGEFWKQSQTNYYLMFSQEGLYLGMFGDWKTNNFTNEAAPNLAGNAFNANLCKVGSDMYMYTSDESIHAGVHRWKLPASGLATIETFEITITI